MPQEALDVARLAVQRATALLVGPLPGKPPRPDGVRWKAPHDYVTDLDLSCERAIAQTIRAAFPGDAIAGEEEERAALGAQRVWHVDPVDGTRNLVAGRPEVAVSIALYEGGQPVVAAIGLPYRGLVLTGSADGAWVNDQPLPRLTQDQGARRTLIGLPGELRIEDDARAIGRMYEHLVGEVEGIRVTGALAYDLACVALGELSGRASLGAKAVDVAAGAFLVARLGGLVTDTTGAPYRLGSPGIVTATSPAVHRTLMRALAAATVAP